MNAYPFPWDRFLALTVSMLWGKRSLASDCAAMVARMHPSPFVHGSHNIPTTGPVIVAANHYQRHGMWIGWPGAVITHETAGRRGGDPALHWLVTGGLRFSQSSGTGREVPTTRAIFGRVARTYQMASLPLTGSKERAAALRHWLAWAAAGHALGIFPEGLDGDSRQLRRPPDGFYGLARIIARRQFPVLAVGVYEVDHRLRVDFGTATPLSLSPHPRAAGEEVMQRIAGLLPEIMRRSYSGTASAETAVR